jgi:hypothetical protein
VIELRLTGRGDESRRARDSDMLQPRIGLDFFSRETTLLTAKES